MLTPLGSPPPPAAWIHTSHSPRHYQPLAIFRETVLSDRKGTGETREKYVVTRPKVTRRRERKKRGSPESSQGKTFIPLAPTEIYRKRRAGRVTLNYNRRVFPSCLPCSLLQAWRGEGTRQDAAPAAGSCSQPCPLTVTRATGPAPIAQNQAPTSFFRHILNVKLS